MIVNTLMLRLKVADLS